MGGAIFVVIFLLLFLLFFIFGRTFGESSSNEKPSPRIVPSTSTFEAKVVRKGVSLPDIDEEFDVFSVDGKGLISLFGKPSESSVRLRIRITSEKNGKVEPVLARVSFSGVEKGVFEYEEEMNMPYQHSETSVFRSFAKIPAPFLIFPHSEWQLLRFHVEFREVWKDSSVVVLPGFKFSKSFSLRFNNSEKGYIEIRDEKKALQFANVKLAVLMSRSDGHTDEREAAKVRSFIRNIFEDEDEDESLKAEFNSVIRECLSVPVSAIPQKISECCREIKDEALSARLDILDLLFDVVMSDGVIAGKELDALEKIALELELDRDEYTKRRDKALPISAYEKSVSGMQTDRLLGISEEMSEEEIRSRLSKLYREWNAKKASSDENIRNQAKEMIKLISEKRASLSAKK